MLRPMEYGEWLKRARVTERTYTQRVAYLSSREVAWGGMPGVLAMTGETLSDYLEGARR